MKYIKLARSGTTIRFIPLDLISFRFEESVVRDKYRVEMIINTFPIVEDRYTTISSPDDFMKKVIKFENGNLDIIDFYDLIRDI